MNEFVKATSRTEYASLVEYRKPRGEKRPDDKIIPESESAAPKRVATLNSSNRVSSVLRATLLKRTVYTTITEWEPADED